MRRLCGGKLGDKDLNTPIFRRGRRKQRKIEKKQAEAGQMKAKDKERF